MRSLLERIVFAPMGAVAGALAVALVEARQALAGVEVRGEEAYARVVAAEIGVLAPLALAIGLAVACASIFVEPRRAVAPSERIAELRAQPVLARSRTAAMVPLATVGATAWCVAIAHAGRRALAAGASMAAGVSLAVESIVWLAALAACVLAAAPALRRKLASAAVSRPRAIDPATTGAIGLAVAAIVIAMGVLAGDAGGEGIGPLAILGVLRRRELDLRPVLHAAAIGACAWLAPVALAGRSLRAFVFALALALAPLAITRHEAHALEHEPDVARAVEGHAPLGRIALALARRATDRDRDGASAFFGGGDCDDRNPNVSPRALEIAGNGIDEDCSGVDLPRAVVPAPAPVAAAAAHIVDRDYSLLFLTVDTLRADELGFMGCPRPTSPRLDALAAKSVVFERAYAMASYTGKALAPMLIGKYPSETLRDGGHFNKYFEGNVFVHERMRGAGVFTMGAASHWYFREAWGMTRGFDVLDLSALPPAGQGDTDTTTTGTQLTDAAIKLLQNNGDKRFFLWVHYFDPHAQYVMHAGSAPTPGLAGSAPDFVDPGKPEGWWMRAAYDSEVWFTDANVGRLLDYVDAQPWGKSTIVVLTSDHGESLGEHGISFQHGWEIWEPLVRVPLVVYVPGAQPHRVPVKRSAIDLVPTMLDLMRVPQPPQGELSGRSLGADLVATSGFEERDVYIDMPDGPNTRMRRALVHGASPGMKLIHFGGKQYQLYDLASDPGEREDLSRDASKLSPMIDAMLQKRATLHEIDVRPDAPAAP